MREGYVDPNSLSPKRPVKWVAVPRDVGTDMHKEATVMAVLNRTDKFCNRVSRCRPIPIAFSSLSMVCKASCLGRRDVGSLAIP